MVDRCHGVIICNNYTLAQGRLGPILCQAHISHGLAQQAEMKILNIQTPETRNAPDKISQMRT